MGWGGEGGWRGAHIIWWPHLAVRSGHPRRLSASAVALQAAQLLCGSILAVQLRVCVGVRALMGIDELLSQCGT